MVVYFCSNFIFCTCSHFHRYSNSIRAEKCTQCTVGRTTQKAKGVTACTVCGAGTYGHSIGQCDVCAYGQYRKGGDDVVNNDPKVCVQCPAGFHQDTQGQASCLPCSPGSSQLSTGAKFCEPCAVNTFSNVTELKTCFHCKVGQVTQEKKGQASCQNCIAGRYGAKCYDCALGQYRAADDPDPTTCDLCPQGFHTGEVGMASCMPCSPGRYENEIGSQACKKCSLGQFSAIPKEVTCQTCSPGYGTPQFGSSFCSKCAKGKFSNSKDTNNACEACHLNFFAASDGSQTCEPCLAGKYSQVESFICAVPQPDPDRMAAPEEITMVVVEDDAYSLTITWEHDSTKGKGPNEIPESFSIEWATTREFKEEAMVGVVDVQGGDARSATIRIDPELELYLLLDPIFIQVTAVGMDVKVKRPFSSSPSKATEPWILAVECSDDEYLNNTVEPILWKCEDCPQGAYCRGPTTWSDVRPLNGYWRVPWQLDQFERCPFVGDCSGVDASDGRRRKYGANGTETNASATDGCIIGTTGILCSRCSPGFNRDANICSQCEDSSMPIRIAILAVVVVLVFALFWSCKQKLKTKWRKYFFFRL